MSRIFLCFFLSFFGPVLGATCQPRAVLLPFKNQHLAGGGQARGVIFQIGGPNSQSVALAPSAYYNETYLWQGPGGGPQAGNCDDSMDDGACVVFRGGLYDPTSSKTWVKNGTRKQIYDGTPANWNVDNVTLEDGAVLSQFQFGTMLSDTNAFVPKGQLGVGWDSKFLQSLGKNISSKSYSFFWGNEVTDRPRDGSLTLGGFDQGLMDNGPTYTSTFNKSDEGCKEGLLVNLTGIGLENSEGSVINAWQGMPALRTCIIATTNNIMTIPESYWAPIEKIIGVKRDTARNGTSDKYFYNTTTITPESATYKGNMTVAIDTDFTVTIPNDQLIFNERYLSPSGNDAGILREDTKVKQIPIVRIPDSSGMYPRIGGMFFSSAYLQVNHDKNQFQITRARTSPAAQQIIAYDTENDCMEPVKVAAVSSGTPSGTPSSTSKPNSGLGNSSESASDDSGLSGGAIAGIVVGVVAGVALVAVAAFLLWRRKRSANDASYTVPSEMEGFGDGPAEKYRHSMAEAYGDHANEMYQNDNPAAYEMHQDNSHFAHELDGSSRPTEVQGHDAMPPRETTAR